MAHRLEITLKKDLFDAEGESICKKARDYFGIGIHQVRVVNILTFDLNLSSADLLHVQKDILTNPVTQISSYSPLPMDFDWCIWVGYRPGVRDNPGSTAVEAMEASLGITFKPGEAVYTSKRFCIRGNDLGKEDLDKIAGSLLANRIIQQWEIYHKDNWDKDNGTGYIIPKVTLNHVPSVTTIPIKSDLALQEISDERNLALNSRDIPVIRAYFLREDVQEKRRKVGLSLPTDIEIEYISQARSDHCNHNTFNGLFHYTDNGTGKSFKLDSLFKTFIEAPTLFLKEKKEWVISVLWDNAGVGRFDGDYYYVITGETHNSPSNMEAYGGAITGIVGVYRDPLGTGKGSKLIMGSYGYCIGMYDYEGELIPHLHPKRLLDGVIEGVRDGGNKSGIPTTFGQVMFHPGYMGKSLVYVTSVGIMPSIVDQCPSENKKTSPGDLVVMCGGRVGKDGIHGVTASSEMFSKNTPAGHVQIGDPYTQKKMHDFILEARDEGLISYITDNGGGGLSSSVGESARFSNGCEIFLENVPLKYEGMDQWEIWISESQERMTLGVNPAHRERFFELSQKHAVESTVIGKYTDSGMLHITHNRETCAYVDIDFLTSGFPQWEFEAEWAPPHRRGLFEPVITEPADYENLLLDILASPNICSKEWITRQYDHEVQGTSVIKPLVGRDRDINSDAVVLRPVFDSPKGLAFSQALLPHYSAIDAYHMTSCTIDEAVRRLIAVGANPEHIGGVDNFCWPNIQYHQDDNPDGKFKAAQLVRSCMALRDICLAYEIPLLSGKDSMYVDGYLPGPYGETRKISALETLQFSTIGLIDDVTKCITMDSKVPGDLLYILGNTRNELGGSEYYDHLGYTGANVPEVLPEEFKNIYKQLAKAIGEGLVASAHGIYRGGIGVHLAMVAMGGGFGIKLCLDSLHLKCIEQNCQVLFSESPGRFIVTVDPGNREKFESLFKGLKCACAGEITRESKNLTVYGLTNTRIIDIPVSQLKSVWKKLFNRQI